MSSPINPEGLVGNPNAVPEELNISRQVEPGGGTTVYPGGGPEQAVDNGNENAIPHRVILQLIVLLSQPIRTTLVVLT